MIDLVPNRAIQPDLRDRYESEGWWTTDSLGALLAHGLSAHPDVVFRVHSTVRPYTGTYGDVERVARRLAGGLLERGVGPGDVIALQLPNWMEAAATFWASSLLGAIVVPIVHFYGRKEVSYILNTVRPAVFITTEEFGRMTYGADLCRDVPIVGLVGQDFDSLLADDPMAGTVETDAAKPALIAFTSGTTRDPKGVVHSHQTLGCEIRQLNAGHPKAPGGQLTALPVGHFIGMLGGLLCPVLEGLPIHLCDTWDPSLALKLMSAEGVGFGGGPTYFITSLLDHPEFTPDHLQYMRYLGLGGSAVPAAVTRRLTDLGLVVTRSYGSTEHPSITGSSPTAAEDKRLLTDGAARSGVEIRLADDGEILSRGPDLCLGYLDPELSAKAFDDDGWYHTGDIGVLDGDGYLTITDRKSDVIIRGGENISAIEVEETLLSMPEVAEAVVVAAPDKRFGERVVAVLRLRPDQSMPDRDRVRAHFEAAGLARQKWPEELREVEDYPRTPSGKVQKFKVRQQVGIPQVRRSEVAGRVEGKVAFVTGAARGQGRSHAVRLAQEGADIIAIDIAAPVENTTAPAATLDDLAETADLIKALDRRVVTAQVDVRDFGGLKAAVDSGVEQLGRLDIVIANAGIGTPGEMLDEMDEPRWEQMMDINLTGVWKSVKAGVPHIKAGGRGGSIILTSSVGGLKAYPHIGHYVTAKHGVVGLMRTFAVELGQHSIRVNSIHPTHVATPLLHNESTFRAFRPDLENPTKDDLEPICRNFHFLPIPWIEAQDVSNAVLFLASDESRYITGVPLPVDAGCGLK